MLGDSFALVTSSVPTNFSLIMDSYGFPAKAFEMRDKFLMASWTYPIAILTVYSIILYVGPKIMAKRKGFQLKNLMLVYNFGQTVLNLFLFIKVCRFLGKANVFCNSLQLYNDDDISLQIVCHHQYILLKVLDLADTIFFVLRKKQRQITFLHVYHHMGMVMLSWISGEYFPGGHSLFLGLANTLVHFVMYFYYALSIISPVNIWWKKYITQLQIAQHFFVLVTTVPLLFGQCDNYPKHLVLLFMANNSLIIFLFGKFYVNQYLDKPEAVVKNKYQ